MQRARASARALTRRRPHRDTAHAARFARPQVCINPPFVPDNVRAKKGEKQLEDRVKKVLAGTLQKLLEDRITQAKLLEAKLLSGA